MIGCVLSLGWLLIFVLLCWLTGQGAAWGDATDRGIYLNYLPQADGRCDRLLVVCFELRNSCVRWTERPTDSLNFTVANELFLEVRLPLAGGQTCCRYCDEGEGSRCIHPPDCPEPEETPREYRLPQPCHQPPRQEEPAFAVSQEDRARLLKERANLDLLPRSDPDARLFCLLLSVNVGIGTLVILWLWCLRKASRLQPAARVDKKPLLLPAF